MTLVATRHESHGGVLHNHMRWDSGDTRVSKCHQEVNNRLWVRTSTIRGKWLRIE